MTKLTALKGTHDIVPAEISVWNRVDAVARDLFSRYGFREMRTPIFERTELFARGIGSDTDVVAKEMYTFEDRGGDSLTLRPEATAGLLRAVIEHNLLQELPAARIWSIGPMFRAENVQKGRYRQFHQIDVEALGGVSPDLDAEIVEVALRFLEACGVSDTKLLINSVASREGRAAYVALLRESLAPVKARLCADCQRRAEKNPLRVLDCKIESCQPVIDGLPKITDHLGAEDRAHFDEVLRLLDAAGISYVVTPRLVRGLDYYTRTTFEFTCERLGAQSTVLGGGRYDGLVKELGGPDAPGIGFALGVERLISLMPEGSRDAVCDVFLIDLTPASRLDVIELQRRLRERRLASNGTAGVRFVRVARDTEGRSFKSKMKLADRLAAPLVVIRGEDEARKGVWTVRHMTSSTQTEVAHEGIVDHVVGALSKDRGIGSETR